MPDNLDLVLQDIADAYALDFSTLKQTAYNDTLPGFPEHRLCAAIIATTGASRILELGTDTGIGTSHLIWSARSNGNGGHITTLDIVDKGYIVPAPYKTHVTFILQDINLWVPAYRGPQFDFIFEDGNHSEFQVHIVYENLEKLLAPGGFIVSHDVNTGMGDYIRNGIRKGGYNFPPVREYSLGYGVTIYRREA